MQAADPKIAPHDTLEGQLQRGRGAGFLRALDAPRAEVHELLVRCITHDPRWDSQIESRDHYYAQLVQATGMDLGPLEHHLRENDDVDQAGWNTNLTVETLGALANRGRGDAAEMLKSYVRYGQWWDWAIDRLVEVASPEAMVGLDEAVSTRFPNDDALSEALKWRTDETFRWWKSFARPDSRLSRAIERASCSTAGSPRTNGPTSEHPQIDNFTAISTLDLIRLATQANWQLISKVLGERSDPDATGLLLEGALSTDRPVSAMCLDALRLRHEPRLLEIVERLLTEETPPWPRRIAMNALASLPPATILPLARRWFFEDAWPLRRAAELIFETRVTAEDVSMLRSTVPAAESAEDYYRLCSILEALGVRADCGPFPELESVFRTATYSYCRVRVARVLAKSDPGFARSFAHECLWDCESETRRVGAAHVDLASPGVLKRLREIESDRGEWKETVIAAKMRLQNLP